MKQYKLKWAYFEPLYSLFLNIQNSSKVIFKKKSCQRHISKKNHAQRIHLKKNTCSVLMTNPTPPTPPTKSNGSPLTTATECRGLLAIRVSPKEVSRTQSSPEHGPWSNEKSLKWSSHAKHWAQNIPCGLLCLAAIGLFQHVITCHSNKPVVSKGP